jgi:CubicO group peptidase (beta-lactamase class C family)
MHRSFVALTATSLCLMALAGCERGPSTATTPEFDAGAAAAAFKKSADDAAFVQAASRVLFWTREEQLAGYPNMEKQFPANTVRKGDTVSALPVSPTPVSIGYTYQGKPWSTDTYLEQNNGAGLLILKDGQIVFEDYAFGLDQTSRWTSFSVAKSFSSTLVGAAIREGFIGSLDDPITQYLPGLSGSAYEGVSVRQLLQMTSGVKWNEDYGDPNSDVARFSAEPSVDGSDPVVSYMARLPREAPPGTKWVYKTGETNLVGSLVRAAVKKPLAEYLSEKIWVPLGMEADAYWMTDLGGGEIAGCCLSATLRDYARFAQFFMNGAKINGVSITPDNWTTEAVTSTPEALTAMNGQTGYGYQWWTSPGGIYEGQGIFGQRITINPAKQLVVVSWSAWPGATDPGSESAQAALMAAIDAHYPAGK